MSTHNLYFCGNIRKYIYLYTPFILWYFPLMQGISLPGSLIRTFFVCLSRVHICHKDPLSHESFFKHTQPMHMECQALFSFGR